MRFTATFSDYISYQKRNGGRISYKRLQSKIFINEESIHSKYKVFLKYQTICYVQKLTITHFPKIGRLKLKPNIADEAKTPPIFQFIFRKTIWVSQSLLVDKIFVNNFNYKLCKYKYTSFSLLMSTELQVLNFLLCIKKYNHNFGNLAYSMLES